MIKKIIFTLFLCVLPFSAHAEATFEKYGVAVLRGLDKPNARVQKIEVPVGKKTAFGPLSIMVRTCRKTTPEDEPETAAFLEITDDRLDKEKERSLFNGWMFASSPALSALEHPIYDVWVLDCKSPIATAPETASPAEKEGAAVPPTHAKASSKKPK